MLKKTSPLLLVLVIGLIYGCGSSNPFVDEIQSSLASNNPDTALESAEQSIEERPGDPLGYYYKGVALGDIADGHDASERDEFYNQMNEAFEIAEMVADTSEADAPDDIQRIGDIKTTLWTKEHNMGIEYATNDSLMNTVDNPLDLSISHFHNATIIYPDSALSWDVMSQVAYMDEDFDLAVEAKNKALDLIDDPEADDYLTLAAYYFNAEDVEGATRVLEEGREAYPEHQDIVTSLADFYQRLGESEKAIQTVRELIEEDPENAQFRLSLGTQIYQTALEISDEIDENYERIFELMDKLRSVSSSETEEIEQKIQEIDRENQELITEYDALSEEAAQELEKSIELNPDVPQAYNTLGIIYQNKASQLFNERNRTMDNEEANKIDEQGKEQLRQAMTYYEQAAELDPENQDYWEALFNVYTTLGMDEKADEAMEKAGLNNN